MWAYRLPKAQLKLAPTITASALRRKIEQMEGPMLANGLRPMFTPAQFDQTLFIAKNMAQSIGWDTSLGLEIECYLVPCVASNMVGFIITQATSGQRFLVSPVPLPYIAEHTDWDGQISEEEVTNISAALSGEPVERPPPKVNPWNRSRKGNLYTTINGAQVTVFPAEDGFKAIIVAAGTDQRVYTHLFADENACGLYVERNFYEITRAWYGPGPAITNNPFAAIDWGSDDD